MAYVSSARALLERVDHAVTVILLPCNLFHPSVMNLVSHQHQSKLASLVKNSPPKMKRAPRDTGCWAQTAGRRCEVALIFGCVIIQLMEQREDRVK